MLNDAEIICGWMEPRPKDGSGPVVTTPDSRWWVYNYTSDGANFDWNFVLSTLTLDALHEVEARLTDQQGWFTRLLVPLPPITSMQYFRLVANATAEQKVKALAAVVREASRE